MRIIDKNTDFYDYLQVDTDTLVFDRRGSYLIDKDWMYGSLRSYRNNKGYRFLLLQCGATFWLIFAKVTEVEITRRVEDYSLEVLSTWRDYDKPNRLLTLEIIDPSYSLWKKFYKKGGSWRKLNRKDPSSVIEVLKENIDDLKNSVIRNDYYVEYTAFKSDLEQNIYVDDKNKQFTYPLLKASGLAEILDPVTLFASVEEYFLIEKLKAERTDPIGITDIDKVESHGFDKKTSFRGRLT